uniref:Protein ECT2 n=1 Tax=Ascaris suum TaxID=6253 RepID=F1KUH2_ASCSU
MDHEKNIADSGRIDISDREEEEGAKRFPSQKRQVKRVCLIGASRRDTRLVALLKDHFSVDVVESENGTEYKDDPNMVFLCSDFIYDQHFKDLQSCGSPIIGPALVTWCAAKWEPLLFPRANRPLYTDSMAGITVALSGISREKCRETANLVRFMGGSVHRRFSPRVTHLITDSVLCSQYHEAVAAQCYVVHLRWVHAAWALRDDINISITAAHFVKGFLVEPFCGLSIWFAGYSAEELIGLRLRTVEHMGKLAAHVQDATHIVVSKDADISLDEFDRRQKIVDDEWFWTCIRLSSCANEDNYKWMERERTKKDHDPQPAGSFLRLHSNDQQAVASSFPVCWDYDSTAGDHEISMTVSCKMSKTDDIGKEMVETEEHYLRALKIIVKCFMEPLEERLKQRGSNLLSKAEMRCIFSRVPLLIDAHEVICNDLRMATDSRTAVRHISEVWLRNAEDLRPLYSAYIGNCDRALEILRQSDANPRFQAFLKSAENRAECQRHMLKDLLVRPVQRLPSVILLLKEMQHKVQRSDRSRRCVMRAINALQDILRTANETRGQVETYAEAFKVYTQIEDYPAGVMSSTRSFLGKLHVLSLGGNHSDWKNTCGKTMALFLFSDLVEIAKMRTAVVDESLPGTLATGSSLRSSLLSLASDKKKYKHYKQYMVTCINRINVIIHSGFEGVFVLSFEGCEEENFWIAQCLESKSGEMRKFLNDLCIQFYYLCGRLIQVEDMRYDVELQSSNNRRIAALIAKALRHTARRCSSQASLYHRSSVFRRAMSSINVISDTLSKFCSKSNLYSVDEAKLTRCAGELNLCLRR